MNKWKKEERKLRGLSVLSQRLGKPIVTAQQAKAKLTKREHACAQCGTKCTDANCDGNHRCSTCLGDYIVWTGRTTALSFMVHPVDFNKMAWVPDSVTLRILKPNSKRLDLYLGKSGRELARDGARFLFARPLAQLLIKYKVAERVE